MHAAFKGASNMGYNATNAPDLSRVSDASDMLCDAFSFNGDLSGWDVSSVARMNGMFSGATSLNQPLLHPSVGWSRRGWVRSGGHSSCGYGGPRRV